MWPLEIETIEHAVFVIHCLVILVEVITDLELGERLIGPPAIPKLDIEEVSTSYEMLLEWREGCLHYRCNYIWKLRRHGLIINRIELDTEAFGAWAHSHIASVEIAFGRRVEKLRWVSWMILSVGDYFKKLLNLLRLNIDNFEAFWGGVDVPKSYANFITTYKVLTIIASRDRMNMELMSVKELNPTSVLRGKMLPFLGMSSIPLRKSKSLISHEMCWRGHVLW